MKESSLWKNLNQLQLRNKRWHLTRIESLTLQGIPDVYAVIEGKSFWLELKSKEGKNLGLSNYQINWHLKHQSAGGSSFILLASTSCRAFKLFRVEVREPSTKTLPDSRSLSDSRSLPYIHISLISSHKNLEKLIRSILN